MISIEGTLLDFRRLDLLANGDSCIHAIDARVKLLVTLVFTVSVVSFNKYEISALLPFFLFPLALAAQGRIPIRYIANKVLLVMPLALMMGIFNPLFDRTTLVALGPLDISGGWISCFSILIRTSLTVSAALVLLSVTGFNNICQALKQIGFPDIFVTQMLLLYRYIFVLAEELERSNNAHSLRSSGARKMKLATFAALVGNLLLRTWDRAERIHQAMLARGFHGEFKTARINSFNHQAVLFLLVWSTLLITMRFINISGLFGRWIYGIAA